MLPGHLVSHNALTISSIIHQTCFIRPVYKHCVFSWEVTFAKLKLEHLFMFECKHLSIILLLHWYCNGNNNGRFALKPF